VPETQEIIAEFIDQTIAKQKIYTLIGTAKNVDEDRRVCDFTPVGDEADRFDVRLQSVISETAGMVLIPKKNSIIGVTFLNRTAGFVSLTSTLEKILIDTDLTQFNGGDNGGLINIDDLITKQNIIEKDLNTVKAAISSWIPVPNDGGAALKVALTSWFSDILTLTVKQDLEDTKVTH